MEARVEEELEMLLVYANDCRNAAGMTGLDPEHFLAPARAYVGGALTVLVNLELITPEERMDWSDRVGAILGEPPAGTARAPAVS